MPNNAILECMCGRNLFIEVFNLRQSGGGGVVKQVAGLRCFECGNKVDTLELLRRRDLKEKEEEVKRLSKEISDGTKGAETRTGTEARPGHKDTRKDRVSNKSESVGDI